jgi:metallo-beta-lactamase class B
MFNFLLKNILFATFSLAITTTTIAQVVQEPKNTKEEWSKPYPPFCIVGNLYYVGTYDLACYLITTRKGNILINTGLAASEQQIKDNVKALGFKFRRIKILLNTQAHYDHLGAMAAIKKQTRAKLMVNEKDATEVISGGSSDYALGGNSSTFVPLTPNRLLQNNDTIKLGNMQLVMLHHPGHTKGSCSFLFTVTDEQKSYKVLIANMPTIVTDSSFISIPSYTTIASDYAYTLKAMKNISFDIWLASHASQFKLHTKHKPDDAYNPAAFIDQAGYDAAINDLQKEYEERLQQNRK